VTVVVLAHNGSELTIDCLDSLGASSWHTLHVLVVDNASNDGTSALIRKRYPDVEVLRSDVNLGFAGGINLGIDHALRGGADHVLILNNDTLVAPDAISRLVDAAVARPNAGAITPLITYAEPPDRIWYAGATYDASKGYPGRVRHYGRCMADVALGPVSTQRFSGAAVLIPSRVLADVGGFDESLFFLYEDVELSLRMRAAGWQIWFEPGAVVRHRVAMTQGGEHSPTSFYYGLRNQLVVAHRHGGRRRPLRTAVTTMVHLARVRHARDRRAALRATLEGLADGVRGRLGPRPT